MPLIEGAEAPRVAEPGSVTDEKIFTSSVRRFHPFAIDAEIHALDCRRKKGNSDP